MAVSNGTVALELSVAALGIGPGDEVILPSFTIISCALAVVRAGAMPVLVDADPETWCMDVDQVEGKITAQTKAVMPVHMYGHPVDMGPLLDVADRHGLAIIEDAAEAHGASYRAPDSADGDWRRCGSFGIVSCFSFYANKLVTTGEGGMVLTDDESVAQHLRTLRNLAFEPERRFLHHELGFNFRLTNVQAAIGLAQVERIDCTVERKREIGKRYADGLSGAAGIRLQPERPWARSVFWMNGLVIDDDTGRDAEGLGKDLRSRGVDTRPFFFGLHRQPALLERGLFAGERYPVTDDIGQQGLYLPSGAGLTDEQVDEVVQATLDALT